MNGVSRGVIKQFLGYVPIMVKSKLCNLYSLPPKALIEHHEEPEVSPSGHWAARWRWEGPECGLSFSFSASFLRRQNGALMSCLILCMVHDESQMRQCEKVAVQ